MVMSAFLLNSMVSARIVGLVNLANTMPAMQACAKKDLLQFMKNLAVGYNLAEHAPVNCHCIENLVVSYNFVNNPLVGYLI